MNQWIVLLTTAINNPLQTMPDTEYRIQLYEAQINRWLNETDYIIVVVESSGYRFPTIYHKRLRKISFVAPLCDSSSQYEAYSILYALATIKNSDYYMNCTHILKVTGRYFLYNIQDVLSKAEQQQSLYLQIHFKPGWQNSEYYGIEKELFETFLETVKENGLMENKLYEFAQNKSIVRIGPFRNFVARGGDKLLIPYL